LKNPLQLSTPRASSSEAPEDTHRLCRRLHRLTGRKGHCKSAVRPGSLLAFVELAPELPDEDYLRPAPPSRPPELRRSVVPRSYSLVTFASLGYPHRFALPKRLTTTSWSRRFHLFARMSELTSLPNENTPRYRERLFVARRGFEPRQTEPKSVVLPLYYRAICPLFKKECKNKLCHSMFQMNFDLQRPVLVPATAPEGTISLTWPRATHPRGARMAPPRPPPAPPRPPTLGPLAPARRPPFK
jgi:hypothetical protein